MVLPSHNARSFRIHMNEQYESFISMMNAKCCGHSYSKRVLRRKLIIYGIYDCIWKALFYF